MVLIAGNTNRIEFCGVGMWHTGEQLGWCVSGVVWRLKFRKNIFAMGITFDR